MILPVSRPRKVKFILPALTEATSPHLAADQVFAFSTAGAGYAGRVSISG